MKSPNPFLQTIDTVIFDIGNVLMGFPWHEYLDSLYDKEMDERIEEAMTADHRWDNLDLGIMSPEEILNLFIKPDRAIYQTICDKYSLDPTKCLFIDDNRDNIQAAKEFGLNAVLFEGYEKTRAEVDRILQIRNGTEVVRAQDIW